MLARRGYRRTATRAAPAETRRPNGADQVFRRCRIRSAIGRRQPAAGKPLRHFRLGFIDGDFTEYIPPSSGLARHRCLGRRPRPCENSLGAEVWLLVVPERVPPHCHAQTPYSTIVGAVYGPLVVTCATLWAPSLGGDMVVTDPTRSRLFFGSPRGTHPPIASSQRLSQWCRCWRGRRARLDSFGTAWVSVFSASCAIRWASDRLVAGRPRGIGLRPVGRRSAERLNRWSL